MPDEIVNTYYYWWSSTVGLKAICSSIGHQVLIPYTYKSVTSTSRDLLHTKQKRDPRSALPGRHDVTCILTYWGHYLNQYWHIDNWTPRNKFQWHFNRNSNIFVQENAVENVVCEMASILSRPQWVKSMAHVYILKLGRRLFFCVWKQRTWCQEWLS